MRPRLLCLLSLCLLPLIALGAETVPLQDNDEAPIAEALLAEASPSVFEELAPIAPPETLASPPEFLDRDQERLDSLRRELDLLYGTFDERLADNTPELSQLRKSQTIWVAYVDSICEMESGAEDSGVLARAMSAACKTRETEARILWLRALSY